MNIKVPLISCLQTKVMPSSSAMVGTVASCNLPIVTKHVPIPFSFPKLEKELSEESSSTISAGDHDFTYPN